MDFAEALEIAQASWELLGYSPRTRARYSVQISAMARFLQIPPAKITTSDLKRYLVSIKRQKSLSNATIYSQVNAIRAFFRALVDNGALSTNPADQLPLPRRSRKLPTYLTPDELVALLRASESNPRDHCLLEFLYATGVRVSEAVAMKVESVNLKEKTAMVKSGKGDKDRLVIMSEHACQELDHYLKKRRVRSEYLFPNRSGGRLSPRYIEKMIRAYAKRARITKPVTPHVLRHTFATHMLDRNVDIRAIQELLGHSSLATTQIYTHVTTERLRRIITAHPREALPDKA